MKTSLVDLSESSWAHVAIENDQVDIVVADEKGDFWTNSRTYTSFQHTTIT